MYEELEDVCVDTDLNTFTLTQKWDKYMTVNIDDINDAVAVRDLLNKFIVEQESE